MVDSKEPIILGQGPDKDEDRVYNYRSLSCFGVALTFRAPGKRKPTTWYFDVLSTNRDHTTYAQTSHLDEVLKRSDVKMLVLSLGAAPEIEVRVDNAKHFVSQEFLYYVTHEIPKHFTFASKVTYSPFPPRHGKSICDRHFQKVGLWTERFRKQKDVPSMEKVQKGIENGSREANVARSQRQTKDPRKKEPIKCVVLTNTLQEPTRPKRKLLCPGITATHGVTYHKSTQKIINHIYPDVDKSVGIELNTVETCEYVRFDSEGNRIPFLLPPYAPCTDPVYHTTTIENQEAQRLKWQQQINLQIIAQRESAIRNQPLLPLS